MTLGWRWDRLDTRRLVRPHRQHCARRVVDHEPGRVTETVWTQARAVTVPRRHEGRA
jgi:hypothetical protein